jgi:hypothetical protein
MNNEELVLANLKITKSESDMLYREYSPYIFASYADNLKVIETKRGVQLDMTEEDFERLMDMAAHGLHHRRFMDTHPAAQDLYMQYLEMYHLTMSYRSER